MEGTGPQHLTSSDGRSDQDYVAAFVQLLVRATEAGRMGARGEPEREGLQSELVASLHACLDRIGDFSIRVDGPDLLHAGEPVYRSPAREGSLPLALFQDGVREIAVSRGITSREVATFVDALRRATHARERSWDDAVTLLWDGDFQHIATTSAPVEELDPGDEGEELIDVNRQATDRIPWPGESEPGPGAQPGESLGPGSAQGRADDWLLTPEAGAPALQEQAGDVARALQEIEMENLRMTATVEQAIPARDQVLAILMELLRTEREPGAFLETASVLGLFIEQAIEEGDFARANRLAARLLGVSGGGTAEPGALRPAANEVLRSAGRAEILRRLTPLLNARADVDLGELTKLLAALGPSAAPTLCDLLCEIQVKRVRRAICEALVVSCKDDVGVLIRQLSDPRWYVVRNVLYVLGRIAHQGVERALGEALFHEDLRVRREAIGALAGVDSPRGRAYLNSALRDPEKEIRILVARLISRRRSDRAAGVIWSVIDSPDFEARDAEERTAFCAALGRTGSDALVPRLEASLTRGARPRPQDRIGRREAALALAWLGTPAALDVLKRGAGSRRNEVRSAVADALEDLRKAAPQDRQAEWGR